MNASELSHRLGQHAMAVCRTYLSNGRKAGRYWQVGNVHNEKGRSLYVRLAGPGVAGKWNDAATGEHGDLLDLIRLACGLPDLSSTMAEAERFLGCATRPAPRPAQTPAATNRADMARRLFAAGNPLAGTLGETYLARRGIVPVGETHSLRFHPRTWFARRTHRPAILAAVQDNGGTITGITRLFLDDDANLIERRALGHLNGHAVRIGEINAPHLLVGEGLESTLSFTVTHPAQALAATLSTAHMAAFEVPPKTRSLTIAADNDPAGRDAAAKLQARALEQGLKAKVILPRLVDFNDDLVSAR